MGKFDLVDQFQRKADRMLLAIKDGRALHGARNIKSSGAPFETSARTLFSDSLPATSCAVSGYFYGANSNISIENDVMIYEAREAFRLDPAPQDQHYVPFSSVSVIGQIKNSAKDLPSAISQIHASMKAWHEMAVHMGPKRAQHSSPIGFRPATFVICGECSDRDLNKLEETLKKASAEGSLPDYILLLDRGLIVAGAMVGLPSDAPIEFQTYRQVASFHLCKPEPENQVPEFAQGVALLWLFFALIDRLSLDVGNNLRYHAFCAQISENYPLMRQRKLL